MAKLVTEKAKLVFAVYRYQILPANQVGQGKLFPPQTQRALEALKKRKNEYFAKVLQETETFKYDHGEIAPRLWSVDDDIFHLRLGANRPAKITKKDASEERVENWPYVHTLINNNAGVQKILIEVKPSVFSTPNVVKTIIADSMNDGLAKYGLYVYMEPLFEEKLFWDLVDKHKNAITKVTFNLITPNMSNISAALKVDLSALSTRTNTQRTELQLNSDPNSALNLEQKNEELASVVGYASEGGGDIRIRARGIRKTISTQKTTKTLEVGELEFSGNAGNSLFGDTLHDIFK